MIFTKKPSNSPVSNVAIPPIDAAAPTQIETATFAMG